jgi:Spy/CpxP family protein refolding chaperone
VNSVLDQLRRLVAVAVSAGAMTLLFSSLPLGAQEPKVPPSSDTKTTHVPAKRSFDPARRVPTYFGQLGLTNEQRESIYKVQGKHMPKIEALEKQIAEIRAQSLTECEGILTASQKQILEQRRESGARPGASRTTSP